MFFIDFTQFLYTKVSGKHNSSKSRWVACVDDFSMKDHLEEIKQRVLDLVRQYIYPELQPIKFMQKCQTGGNSSKKNSKK